MYNIFEHYDVEELLGKNFKRRDLGLVYDEWHYNRGGYERRDYFHETEKNLVIRELYEYEYAQEPDGLKRNIIKAIRMIQWFDGEENVGHEEIVKVIDKKQSLKRLNREIRRNRIDFLEVRGEELIDIAESIPVEARGVEPYKTQFQQLMFVSSQIFTLLRHYSNEIITYVDSGDPLLELRIREEMNEQIQSILGIVTVPPGQDPRFPSGMNVKQSILFQMTGETEV
jgi:hypothetical protein